MSRNVVRARGAFETLRRVRVWSLCGLLLGATLSASAHPAGAKVSLPSLAQVESSIRFDLGTLVPLAYRMRSCAAVDLDGANGPDLVAGGDSAILVLRNLGNGTFGTEVDFAMGGTLSAFAIGDLDGDGRRDLIGAVTGASGPSIVVRRGQSGFQFGPPVVVQQATLATAVAIADMNGDAHPDLVAVSVADDSLRVLANDGVGGLANLEAIRVPAEAFALETRDLNGDGRPDVVVLHHPSGGSNSSVLTIVANRGASGLELAQSLPRPVEVYDATLLDANRDGVQDLALLEADGVFLATGLGNATFANATPLVQRAFEKRTAGCDHALGLSIAGADIDNDGDPDLEYGYAEASFFGERNYAAVLTGRGGGSFDAPRTYVVPFDPEMIQIADFNGDQAQDLAVFTRGDNLDYAAYFGPCEPSAHSVTVLSNLGDGRLSARLEVVFDPNSSAPPGAGSIVGARLRAHVTPDLVVTHNDHSYAVLNEGRNRFTAPIDIGPGRVVAAKDLDGDLLDDLVLARNDTTSVWRSLGTGHLAASASYVGGTWCGLADLDGDGRDDLALRVSDTLLSMRRGAPDGSFGSLVALDLRFVPGALQTGSYVPRTTALAVSDLDRDGLADVIAGLDGPADSAAVYFNLGGGQFSESRYELPRPSGIHTPREIAAGDVDGDGRSDVVVLIGGGNGTDQDGTLDLLLNRGGRTFQPRGGSGEENSPASLHVADLNRDGRADVLTVDANGGATLYFYVHESSGDSLLGTTQPYHRYLVSDLSSALAVADIDADGRPEAVTYTPRYGSLMFTYNRSIAPQTIVTEPPMPRPESLSLLVEGVRPNPARGRPSAAFSLRVSGAVMLEVLDVTGRRVVHQQFADMMPGPHLLPVEPAAGGLPPGMYLMRLSQGRESRTARFAVIR